MATEQADQLSRIIETHGAAIRKHLPEHLHHLAPFKVEVFGLLTKYTLGEARPGVWAMLHCIDGSDGVPYPHNHPCRFDSYGIKGDYWEHSYHEDERTELTLRAAGGNYTIWPNTIHEVVGSMNGPVWTLVFAYDVVQQARHFPELVTAS